MEASDARRNPRKRLGGCIGGGRREEKRREGKRREEKRREEERREVPNTSGDACPEGPVDFCDCSALRGTSRASSFATPVASFRSAGCGKGEEATQRVRTERVLKSRTRQNASGSEAIKLDARRDRKKISPRRHFRPLGLNLVRSRHAHPPLTGPKAACGECSAFEAATLRPQGLDHMPSGRLSSRLLALRISGCYPGRRWLRRSLGGRRRGRGRWPARFDWAFLAPRTSHLAPRASRLAPGIPWICDPLRECVTLFLNIARRRDS